MTGLATLGSWAIWRAQLWNVLSIFIFPLWLTKRDVEFQTSYNLLKIVRKLRTDEMECSNTKFPLPTLTCTKSVKLKIKP